MGIGAFVSHPSKERIEHRELRRIEQMHRAYEWHTIQCA
jgi:hypothetical protein